MSRLDEAKLFFSACSMTSFHEMEITSLGSSNNLKTVAIYINNEELLMPIHEQTCYIPFSNTDIEEHEVEQCPAPTAVANSQVNIPLP